MTDGYYEEIDHTWIDDWPFEDDPDEYERLNSVLPSEFVFVPIYAGDKRVALLERTETNE